MEVQLELLVISLEAALFLKKVEKAVDLAWTIPTKPKIQCNNNIRLRRSLNFSEENIYLTQLLLNQTRLIHVCKFNNFNLYSSNLINLLWTTME